jgi:hypothetical protein
MRAKARLESAAILERRLKTAHCSWCRSPSLRNSGLTQNPARAHQLARVGMHTQTVER